MCLMVCVCVVCVCVLCYKVSYDGVPFLLHDPHTIRTTDVKSKCPDVDPLANATWLNYTSGKCPLEELNVGAWFINEVRQ